MQVVGIGYGLLRAAEQSLACRAGLSDVCLSNPQNPSDPSAGPAAQVAVGIVPSSQVGRTHPTPPKPEKGKKPAVGPVVDVESMNHNLRVLRQTLGPLRPGKKADSIPGLQGLREDGMKKHHVAKGRETNNSKVALSPGRHKERDWFRGRCRA